MSILSEEPIQHWLNTPMGSIYGYPSYGNNIEEMLFVNKHKMWASLEMILNKMAKDIGVNEAEKIENASIFESGRDEFVIVISLGYKIAIGEYHAT